MKLGYHATLTLFFLWHGAALELVDKAYFLWQHSVLWAFLSCCTERGRMIRSRPSGGVESQTVGAHEFSQRVASIQHLQPRQAVGGAILPGDPT